jgi:hypothetical protein
MALIIIHASSAFAKRYRLKLSLPGEKVPQTGRLDAWSAHFLRIGRKPVVLFMNDASLWAIIIPATGLTTLEKLLPILLGRIAEVWSAHGAGFDSANQSVMFLKRSNRSLIGSMNDAVSQIRFVEETCRAEGGEIDWAEMEANLNRMPSGAMKYDCPQERLAALLGGDA